MNVSVEKLPRSEVALTIELSEAEYKPFLEKAANAVSQHTSIPGFRPGKADYETVKKRVGEGELWQQAFEFAVKKTLFKALDDEKLVTVGQPHVDVEKLAPGNPVVYKARVSLLPNVEVVALDTIKVSTQKVEVPADHIEKTLEELRKSRAASVVVDRAIQEGDKAEVSYELFLEKVPMEGGAQQKVPMVIGETKFIPGFEDQLLGMKSGEEKKFDLEMPKEHHQKELAGRTVTFKVKVDGVFEQKLPELDDAFAQGMGPFNTLDQLKKAITENAKREAELKELGRQEEELLDTLIEKSKIDELPNLLVDSEVKKMRSEMEQNLAQRGISMADYVKHLGKTEEEILLDFTPQAIKRVKSALLIRKIGQEKKIEATEEEINAEVEQNKHVYGHDENTLKQIESQEYKDYLHNVITSRKIIEEVLKITTKQEAK